MPFDRSKYPEDWEDLRLRILCRAGERRDADGKIVQEAMCEICGKARNHWFRHGSQSKERYYRMRILSSDVQIVLTTMHLDHDTTNNDESNLKAGCQRCHLRYDAAQHAANAKASREAKTGQGDLFN
jgi:hypothetical protein